MPKRSCGRPAKLGHHQLFSLRLPSDLHGALRHYALDDERSLNDVLVQVIQDWWHDQGDSLRHRYEAGGHAVGANEKPQP